MEFIPLLLCGLQLGFKFRARFHGIGITIVEIGYAKLCGGEGGLKLSNFNNNRFSVQATFTIAYRFA
jgi:hypothetical protein